MTTKTATEEKALLALREWMQGIGGHYDTEFTIGYVSGMCRALHTLGLLSDMELAKCQGSIKVAADRLDTSLVR